MRDIQTSRQHGNELAGKHDTSNCCDRRPRRRVARKNTPDLGADDDVLLDIAKARHTIAPTRRQQTSRRWSHCARLAIRAAKNKKYEPSNVDVVASYVIMGARKGTWRLQRPRLARRTPIKLVGEPRAAQLAAGNPGSRRKVGKLAFTPSIWPPRVTEHRYRD